MENSSLSETDEYEIIARQLMKNMLYDNGVVNRFNPEKEQRYKLKSLVEITLCCKNFFCSHPEFITDDDLFNISCGNEDDNNLLYAIYPEYEALSKALNKYFDIM